jgi:hypothetical protein
VARLALIRVEARPKPVVATAHHNLDFSKPGLPVLKKRDFVGGKAGEGITSAWRATAHPRIYGRFHCLSGRLDAGRVQ